MTAKEAAAELGCSLTVLYCLVEQRQIAHYRIGKPGRRGSIRIDPADVQAFKNSRRVPAEPRREATARPAPARQERAPSWAEVQAMMLAVKRGAKG